MTSSSPSRDNRLSERSKRIALAVLAVIGFCAVLAWVFGPGDADDIIDDFATLGWAIGFIIALHVVVIACDGTAWWVLLGRQGGASFVEVIWARWVREATNFLLPVAQVGGEVVGARLLVLRGTPVRIASAGVALDKFSEALSQIPFTLIGLVLLLELKGETQLGANIAIGLSVPIAAVAVGVLAYRVGWCGPLERSAAAIFGRWRSVVLDRIDDFLASVRSIYRPRRLLVSSAWHLMAWSLGAGELWLALMFMGHPIGIPEAIAVESLSQAITSLGFIVPGAVGVQEAAYIAAGMALGVPADAAFAFSLVTRVQQMVLGLPALLSWQALELRHLLAAAVGKAPASAQPPSSHSNSYVRRFVRTLLRPFAAIGLTPDAITLLRIVTGFAACAACSVGVPLWNHWGAGLWLVSALLDRGDGEFARLTGHTTQNGHLLDYWGDVAINALIFVAIGVNLRHAELGQWSVVIGAIVAFAVAIASIIAEALELRIGEKTVPSRHGFDSDDIIFVLVPILWFGYLMPLLIGALIGGVAATVYIWHRLAHFSRPATADLDAGAVPVQGNLSQLPSARHLP